MLYRLSNDICRYSPPINGASSETVGGVLFLFWRKTAYCWIAGATRAGRMDNPQGCKEGTLVNEEVVKKGLATAVRYKERGELKYEARLIGR